MEEENLALDDPAWAMRPLLWDHIKTVVPEVEMDEVKRALGSSVVEQIETLKAECAALVDIVKTVRADNLSARSKLNNQIQSRMRSKVPAKNILQDEIRIFAEELMRKSEAKGDLTFQPPLTTPRDRSVYGYVMSTSRSSGSTTHRTNGSRASSRTSQLSGESGSPRSRPVTPGASGLVRPVSRSSAREDQELVREHTVAVEQTLSALTPQLTVANIDTVVERLRTALKEEVDTLIDDAEYFQLCLMDEVDDRPEDLEDIAPPSMNELRAVGNALRDQLHQMETQEGHQAYLEALPDPASSSSSSRETRSSVVPPLNLGHNGGRAAAGPPPGKAGDPKEVQPLRLSEDGTGFAPRRPNSGSNGRPPSGRRTSAGNSRPRPNAITASEKASPAVVPARANGVIGGLEAQTNDSLQPVPPKKVIRSQNSAHRLRGLVSKHRK
eukprot:TRINITY_DN167_c0_g1_i1.p1 TRINITY_DN167_c0_g1~~TRINITY_DN167_c0_g1_i1.p1  ORF type:complete len:440 (-),score=56.70 TRINITY_DN167_c0_g1_i1:2394-3713(-)